MIRTKRPMRKMIYGGPSNPYEAAAYNTVYNGVVGAGTIQPGMGRPAISSGNSWGRSAGGSAAAGNAAGVVGGVANLGIGMVNAIDTPNVYGNPSTGATTATGALSGAAIGATAGSVIPGVGTAIGAAAGAVIGGVTGLIKAKKMRKKEAQLFNDAVTNRRKYDEAVSQALAQDPTLVQGNRGADYFADGGPMIKPENRGKFTRWAKNHGMSVGEATSKVLANKDHYSEGVRKMAQFSRNFGGHENGGVMDSAPLAQLYMLGGTANPLNSNSVEMSGNTHANGGIQIPTMNAELEDGETTSGNFVFSEKLGFAKMHKPIAKAIGKIEKKVQTPERIFSLERLKEKERNLAEAQETLKIIAGLQK